jgi:hypothetical protein
VTGSTAGGLLQERLEGVEAMAAVGHRDQLALSQASRPVRMAAGLTVPSFEGGSTSDLCRLVPVRAKSNWLSAVNASVMEIPSFRT